MTRWFDGKEAKRKKDEAEVAAKAQAARARAEEKASASGRSAEQIELAGEAAASRIEARAPIPEEPQKTIYTGSGTVSVRKRWTYAVENLDEIPRKYLALDGRSLQKDIDQGIREVPGVRIFEESGISGRTR